jgi:hypothetical protein
MATDAEIWRTARTLIRLHGEHAPRYALASVHLLLERGDLRRAADWRRVFVAAEDLLREAPMAQDTVH